MRGRRKCVDGKGHGNRRIHLVPVKGGEELAFRFAAGEPATATGGAVIALRRQAIPTLGIPPTGAGCDVSGIATARCRTLERMGGMHSTPDAARDPALRVNTPNHALCPSGCGMRPRLTSFE